MCLLWVTCTNGWFWFCESLLVFKFWRKMLKSLVTSSEWNLCGLLVFSKSLKYCCHCSGGTLSTYCGLSRHKSKFTPFQNCFWVFLLYCELHESTCWITFPFLCRMQLRTALEKTFNRLDIILTYCRIFRVFIKKRLKDFILILGDLQFSPKDS